jgi:hypothetical protein
MENKSTATKYGNQDKSAHLENMALCDFFFPNDVGDQTQDFAHAGQTLCH